MDDEPVRRATAPKCHGQRLGDQLGAHVAGQRPPHDSATRQVDDSGQVRPPLPGGDVGDVADIAAIDVSPGAKGALNEVESRLGSRVGDGGLAPPLLAAAFEAHLAHEPAHPAFPAAHTALSQLFVDPRGPIGALGLGVDLLDLIGQFGVGDVPGRGDVLAALVIGGPGDLEQVTSVLHAVACGFLRLDERIHAHRVSRAHP